MGELVFLPSTGRVNMRGLILLLPVLLVLFLAGNVRTEEESSLVGEAADLSSNLLPIGEKVEVREAREAGKGDDRKKKKDKKKKKNDKKPDRIKKRKKNRKLQNKKEKSATKNTEKKKIKKNKQGKKKADMKKK